MVTDFPSVNWNEALREFLFHVKASRADATLRFYDVRLRQLVQWADANRVSFADFGKRHLDRYLIDRRGAGIAPMTLRHDAVSAKAFFRWCQRKS